MSDPAEPSRPAAEPQSSARGPIVALILLAVLALGGVWLASHMRAANRVQDCVMAGRSNCAPLN